MTKIVSAFPCTGKTKFYEYCLFDSDKVVMDSDSSKFDKENFPTNYVEHIKEHIGKVDLIFVSSHESVRKALTDAGIDFMVCYPVSEAKNEYITRARQRGSSPEFIQMLDTNWYDFLKQMANQEASKSIILGIGEYLLDYKHELI